MHTLVINDLHATVDGKPILKGIRLTVRSDEIHAIMGPNGSGKSTLANVLMGHPKYHATNGSVTFDGIDMLALPPEKRAHLGLFLGFQYPREIPGATFGNFLRLAKHAIGKSRDPDAKPLAPGQFLPILKKEMAVLGMKPEFLGRSLNDGFSGGEKKRAEIVQLAILEPKMAVLDETDSGLDIDALKQVAHGIKTVFERTHMGVLLITHYQRILNYITPHYVHIMIDGTIVRSGGKELAHELEEKGYEGALHPIPQNA